MIASTQLAAPRLVVDHRHLPVRGPTADHAPRHHAEAPRHHVPPTPWPPRNHPHPRPILPPSLSSHLPPFNPITHFPCLARHSTTYVDTTHPHAATFCTTSSGAIEVHKVLYLSRNLRFNDHQAVRLPRNLHIEGHRVLCLPPNLQTSHMSKSQDSLHLSRNLSSLTITTMSKVLRLPRKLHFEIKHLRSLAPVTKSRLWSTKTRGFPCACHEK